MLVPVANRSTATVTGNNFRAQTRRLSFRWPRVSIIYCYVLSCDQMSLLMVLVPITQVHAANAFVDEPSKMWVTTRHKVHPPRRDETKGEGKLSVVCWTGTVELQPASSIQFLVNVVRYRRERCTVKSCYNWQNPKLYPSLMFIAATRRHVGIACAKYVDIVQI